MDGRPQGFATFRNAADADCAVCDNHQGFPHGPADVKFARVQPPNPVPVHGDPMKDPWRRPEGADKLKVFVAGLGFGEAEEEIGDYFSQWGLVAMVKKVKDSSGKDKGFGFIHFTTEMGPLRLLLEPTKVRFKGKSFSSSAPARATGTSRRSARCRCRRRCRGCRRCLACPRCRGCPRRGPGCRRCLACPRCR